MRLGFFSFFPFFFFRHLLFFFFSLFSPPHVFFPFSSQNPPRPRKNNQPAPSNSWLGAEERHLDKYASWWRSRGWETRLIAFDASTTMSFAAAEKAFDQHLADLAARLAARASVGASPRLAFHAFSNTGWIMYARFVELLAPLGIRAAGAVIDSAPHTAICTKVWAAGFVSATSPKLPPAAAAKTLRYRAARALFKASKFVCLVLFFSGEVVVERGWVVERKLKREARRRRGKQKLTLFIPS